MAAHSWIFIYLNISSELIIKGNSLSNTISVQVGILIRLHVINYIVALIYL
jgi:hypothetical protein